MINSRAHKVGDDINAGILNVQFRETYNKFLVTIVEKKALENEDWLNLTYYLLLQDRVSEAMDTFKRFDPKQLENDTKLRIQYDYMTAYLDFFNGFDTQFKEARRISKLYEEYPVLSWRVLFTEILDQLQEYDGEETPDIEIDQEDESKKKANLKKSKALEPTLNFTLEGKDLVVEYTNITEVTLKYYIIDPEILFSRAPFLMQNTEDFAYTRPCKTEIIPLEKDKKELRKEIGADFSNQNVVIEIVGAGK